MLNNCCNDLVEKLVTQLRERQSGHNVKRRELMAGIGVRADEPMSCAELASYPALRSMECEQIIAMIKKAGC